MQIEILCLLNTTTDITLETHEYIAKNIINKESSRFTIIPV